MNLKKFSELQRSQSLKMDDIVPLVTRDETGELHSMTGTIEQLRDTIEFNMNIIDVVEVDPPEHENNPVWLLIAGQKVKAQRFMSEIPIVKFPGDVPRFIPALYSFRAAIGYQYNVPFVAVNGELSELTVQTDQPERISDLSVTKVDNQSGMISFITNFETKWPLSSTITVTDEKTKVSLAICILHSLRCKSLRIQEGAASVSISNTQKTIKFSVDSDSFPLTVDDYCWSVIQPVVTVGADINFKTNVGLNYFGQANIGQKNAARQKIAFTLVFDGAYKGALPITVTDTLSGAIVSFSPVIDFS